MNQHPHLERRLEALETESRRWRRAAGFFALLLVGLLSYAFAPPSADEVRARRFVLVDGEGEELGRMEADSTGHPQLHLVKDKQQVFLSTNGPSIVVRGGDGKRGAFLGVEPNGVVRLDLKSERFIDGLRLSVGEDGSSGIYSLDTKGFERAHLETLADGSASVGVRNDRGQVRGLLGIDRQALSHLLLLDGDGGRRIGLVQPADAIEPTIFAVEDANGNVRSELKTNLDGSPTFTLYSSAGDASFQAP